MTRSASTGHLSGSRKRGKSSSVDHTAWGAPHGEEAAQGQAPMAGHRGRRAIGEAGQGLFPRAGYPGTPLPRQNKASEPSAIPQ